MVRTLWIVGEVVAGVVVSGGIAAAVVPLAIRFGWPNGPWMIWIALAVGITLCVTAGERFRKSLKKA